MNTTSAPPRHCTGCAVRIVSLTDVTVHERYGANRWEDLCEHCDPDTDPLLPSWLPVRRAARR